MASVGVALVACSTVKVPTPSGGSKADGIIRMSYKNGMFETASADWDAAEKIAAQRCSDWGYKGAKRFGVETSACQAYDSGICISSIKTVEYQCTN